MRHPSAVPWVSYRWTILLLLQLSKAFEPITAEKIGSDLS
jgi:hypothetical protein